MALLIGDNFSYNGKKPNFERDSFETLAALKVFAEANIDNGHIAYCAETNKHYIFNSSNSDDATTGKWRVLESEFSNKVNVSDLDAYLTKTDAQATYQPIGDYATSEELTEGLAEKQPVGDYALKSEIPDISNLASKDEIPDISNLATKSEIPTKVSELENDSNFLTTIPEEYVTDSELQEALDDVTFTLPIASDSVLGGIKVGAGLAITDAGILSATGGGVADSVNWENVVGRPTNLSQFTNDSGFITNSALADYALKSEIPDTSNFATKTELSNKQDTLVSGTNIKSVNNQSLLGSGNINISSDEVYHINGDVYTINSTPEDELDALFGGWDNFVNAVETGKIIIGHNLVYDDSIASLPISVFKTKQGVYDAYILMHFFKTGITGVSNGMAWITVYKTSSIHKTSIGNFGVAEELTSNEVYPVESRTLYAEFQKKQDVLIGSGEGQNIKTINGTSLLGSGNIVIESGGGSGIMDVLDNKTYARTQGSWVDLTDYLVWGEYN